jgi:hypothetical protein
MIKNMTIAFSQLWSDTPSIRPIPFDMWAILAIAASLVGFAVAY